MSSWRNLDDNEWDIGRFTHIGHSIWDWAPFATCSSSAKLLWLFIYTRSSDLIPGLLYRANAVVIADLMRESAVTTSNALDELHQRGLVAHSTEDRMIRLITLPDRAERPHNAKHVSGWFQKFISLPVCRLRDDHLDVIKWLCNPKRWSTNMQFAWETTFGTLAEEA